jgi:hypothetical protein
VTLKYTDGSCTVQKIVGSALFVRPQVRLQPAAKLVGSVCEQVGPPLHSGGCIAHHGASCHILRPTIHPCMGHRSTTPPQLSALGACANPGCLWMVACRQEQLAVAVSWLTRPPRCLLPAWLRAGCL